MYNLYYSDGGHCGPFKSLEIARNRARELIKNHRSQKSLIIEIRPIGIAKQRGEFIPKNPHSEYVRDDRKLIRFRY